MATSNPAFNFVILLFLLVPGYAALRGYLSATKQIDDHSRLDKVLVTVILGIVILIVMVVIHRFGVFYYLLDSLLIPLASEPESTSLGYEPDRAVTTQQVQNLTALSLLLFIGSQSAIGYVGAYLIGTGVYIRSDDDIDVGKNLEQPWDTAVKLSAIGDDVTVITKAESDKIQGEIYRIGSPSEDFDLLLTGANRIRDGDPPEPLGMTYLHYEDISQVRFREIIPEKKQGSGNWFIRKRQNLEGWFGELYGLFAQKIVARKIEIAVKQGELLSRELENSAEEQGECD